jgi:DNA primase
LRAAREPAGVRARQQLKDRRCRRRRSSSSGSATRQLARRVEESSAQTGIQEGILLQSGLIVRRDSGEIVDRFRNRLMVPICRDTGSVIAFGGGRWTRIKAARSI